MSEVRDTWDGVTRAGITRNIGFLYKVRRAGLILILGLAIFLTGLVPMWWKARENANQRDAAQRELRLNQIQNALSAAAIEARRGEYETARQTASDFFTSLKSQVDEGDKSALTGLQRAGVSPLLVQHDDIIKLLSRSDPASADRLSDIYIAYRKAISSPSGQIVHK